MKSLNRELQFDFNIYASREIEFHQGIDRFGRGLVNINDAMVRPGFKVLPRVFINVGRSQHTINPATSGEGNRTDRSGICPIGSIDNLLAGRV